MEVIELFILNFISLTLEASPWLCLGLIIAGLMKSWLPEDLLSKHLSNNKSAVVKAAVIGAPLPLCSCGVIPVATQLRRSGASEPATASFLVATPETGIDSVSVSYALLGPIIAIYRPIAAISSAIITGFLVATIKTPKKGLEKAPTDNKASVKSCCSKKAVPTLEVQSDETKSVETTSCCASKKAEPVKEEKKSCCSSKPAVAKTSPPSAIEKTITGAKYAFGKLLDDIIKWLALGLVFATCVKTFIPTDFLTQYGSGLPAMALMITLSIPMYICATASTPVAAGFIMAGISPGTALVFMMAGPATNISTLGVIKNEMGSAVLWRYLAGVACSAITFGLLLDFGLQTFNINISDQMHHSHELLNPWIGYITASALVLFSIKPLRRLIYT